jgi:hypothetical protein
VGTKASGGKGQHRWSKVVGAVATDREGVGAVGALMGRRQPTGNGVASRWEEDNVAVEEGWWGGGNTWGKWVASRWE